MTMKRSRPYALAAIAALLLLTTATAPTRKRALTPDQQSVEALTLRGITWQGSRNPYVAGMAIDGMYALSMWNDGSNAAGEALLSKASGSWKVIVSSGGAFDPQELSSTFAVDPQAAQFLVHNLRPLPPLQGLSASADGIAKYQSERCRVVSIDAQGRHVAKYATIYSGEHRATYTTAPVHPTNAGNAVTIDITPTIGPVTVTLHDPSGHEIYSAVVPAGLTGGAGYFYPTAPAGVYTYTIRGRHVGDSGACVGGEITSRTTVTDAAWTGTVWW